LADDPNWINIGFTESDRIFIRWAEVNLTNEEQLELNSAQRLGLNMKRIGRMPADLGAPYFDGNEKVCTIRSNLCDIPVFQVLIRLFGL